MILLEIFAFAFVILFALVLTLGIKREISHRRTIKEATHLREVLLPAITRGEIEFAILLRSTPADLLFSGAGGGAKIITDEYYEKVEVRNQLRVYLSDRMRPLPLLAIKNSKSIHALVSFDYDENRWKELVLRDLRNASLILVIPIQITEAVLWELSKIKELNLLFKLHFVIPPSSSWRLTREQRSMVVSSHYEAALRDISSEELDRRVESTYLHAAGDFMESLWIEAAAKIYDETQIDLGKYVRGGGIYYLEKGTRFHAYLPWDEIFGPAMSKFSENTLRKRQSGA